jgi:hypothetical protein
MKRVLSTLGTIALIGLGLLAFASVAAADFGLEEFDVTYTNEDGSPATQAGSHPFAMTTTVHFNMINENKADGEVKDVIADQIAGLVADPTAVPRCSIGDFLEFINGGLATQCPDNTALGYAATETLLLEENYAAVYNLDPPPGSILKLGFIAANTPVTIDVGLRPSYPYNGKADVTNIPQSTQVFSSELTLWGNPADPAHDPYRGLCVSSINQKNPKVIDNEWPIPDSYGECKSKSGDAPLLTLPRACEGPLASSAAADSWQAPGAFLPDGAPDLSDPNWVTESVLTHDDAAPPNPQGLTGCSKLPFSPSISARPTTKAASSPTGLDFSLDVQDPGLTSPEGYAASDIKKTVVTLPKGFTTNPSIAEGLEVCSEGDLERETVDSQPGVGCPDASKVGTVEVETPLLDENVNGALYIANPYENPFGSLLALYMVIKNPVLGIIVKQPLKVETDPQTGQITTVAENLPQLPFSHFRLHFREGTRSPLASPPTCGEHEVKAVMTPWAGGPPVSTTSTFSIISGPDGGPCPSGGTPPFNPGLVAGTVNNAAGTYSPFNLQLTRSDAEQEFTRFSIKLPPGIVAKLAGVPYCPDAAIAAAKARTGPNGGAEELAAPSCPAASQIGTTLVGAGVGPSLAYAPGKIYLAGPYNGSALSIAAITAAKVGPFDLGTVVIREAIEINPNTAEVFIDSTGSDPIPHIIKGIPVHARDIRAYVDRPQFTLNPTNCSRTSTASTVLGSGTDFGSAADDNPFTVTSPFQAADCAALGFKPKLQLFLKGGTKRGKNPALKAILTARPGDANIGRAQVTLPRSAFLEQGHIETICTRVQFNAGEGNGAGCPAASVYGTAKAITPILDEPVEGPVFLRSNGDERELPDLVAALHSGQIDFNLVGYIDSNGKGQIRNTFATPPDVPVQSFTLNLNGGKKSLIANSVNLCLRKNRALADFTGQNGKRYTFKPVVKASCKKKGGKGKAKRSDRGRS